MHLEDSTLVTRALDQKGIPYRLFRHPGQVHSLEQAAADRGQRPEQVIRSLLFRLSKDEYAMVLVAGPAQVSWPALRKYLDQSRLTTATEAELLAATGYAIGAVSPFGLPRPMRVLIDSAVLAEQEVSLGSGVRGLTVILSSAGLRHGLPGAEVGSFAVPAKAG